MTSRLDIYRPGVHALADCCWSESQIAKVLWAQGVQDVDVVQLLSEVKEIIDVRFGAAVAYWGPELMEIRDAQAGGPKCA